MEFTPKKQPLSAVNTSAVRHNPYASGGGQFIRKYAQHRSTFLVTPPRANGQRKFVSRTDRILSSSSKKHNLPEKNAGKQTPVRPKNSQATKRPFQAINVVDSNDPYNLFTDSDEENRPSPRKETKSQATKDKENQCQSSDEELFISSKDCKRATLQKGKSLFENPKPKTVKVYSNKRKSLPVNKSRLVGDISPDKVEKAYGPKSLFVAEKENFPASCATEASSSSQVLSPHLIGFPNYGNTCYLNSVLQSLLGLPTFLCDYHQITSELGLNNTSLFYGLGQVLYNRMKGQTSGVKVSLRTVKENLERIDGSFSGFKMQDANEFLTKVLDIIKDEIDRCYESQSVAATPESQEAQSSCTSDVDEDIFLSGTKKDTTKVLNFTPDTEVNFDDNIKDSEIVNCSTEYDSVTVVHQASKSNTFSKKVCVSEVHDGKAQDIVCETKKETVNILKNPVKDNFEFQLLESYRCLGCGEVEGRRQSYFGLYVNLPDDGGHTIQDAISTYMGTDERELTCEKCGHDASSVVTSITSLPRILIIQLKRYEYKPEQCESIKMSSKVLVNRWISLDKFMTDDVEGPSHWNPEFKSASHTPQNPRQSTLTVRNLSSELNKCDSKDESDLPSLSPAKPLGAVSASAADNEDEELQMVMRRSMEDAQGGHEEDEIQQAIRLSLQEMGMSYSQENQDGTLEEDNEKEQAISVNENQESGQHAYCLISIISHFGLTTNTGHYVSDVYNCDEDSWFHYDDESVAKISESVVFAEGRQKNGYIFFYMHKDLFQKVKNKAKR